MHKPLVVIITGHPGSGKTHLGRWLSDELKLPFFGKDNFKDIIFDNLGYSDKAWSLKASATTHRIVDYLLDEELRTGHSLIVEGNFKPEIDNERFAKLRQTYDFQCVQILCWAQGDVLFERFIARQNTPERNAGHVEAIPPEQIKADLSSGKLPTLNVADVTLEFDTSDIATLDYRALAQNIRAAS